MLVSQPPLTGTRIKLGRCCDLERPCCDNFGTIVEGTRIHANGIRCAGAELGDLVGGHLGMAITTFLSVIGQVRGGLLRAVAVTGAARSPILPDLELFAP
jgi:hypothetical protein